MKQTQNRSWFQRKSTRSADKRARKTKAPRDWGQLPWKPLLGLAIGAVFIAWWVFNDPAGWFRLKQIKIAGRTPHLSIADIHNLITVKKDVPLMALELDPIRARIEDHAWVQSVSLRRLLPDTLYVSVHEHKPAAIALLEKSFLVSDHGVIFKQARREEMKKLPLITGLHTMSKDKDVEQVHRRILESIAVIHQLKATGALDHFGLSEVHWAKGYSLSLLTEKQPFRIELGEAPWREKLDRLVQVLPHLEKSPSVPARIALDHKDGVVVRYKPTPAESRTN